MEKTSNTQEAKLKRAKRRIESLKGFYMHLASYVLINMFILVNIYLQTSGSGEGFWQWKHFFVAIFWGIGLGIHASWVFAFNPFFGHEWEQRQIEKIMKRDEREARKYR